MFRTSPVHPQERFVEAVYADYGLLPYADYSTRPAGTKYLDKPDFELGQHVRTRSGAKQAFNSTGVRFFPPKSKVDRA